MLKRILSIIGGVLIAFCFIFLAEMLSGKLYSPPGTDFNNPDSVKKMMELLPTGAFLIVLLGYAFASFAGGITATLIGGKEQSRSALITGGVLMVGGIMNLIELHHPAWFVVVDLCLYIPFAYLGFLVVKK